ncbi:MarR family winged helix-turn-helix transcriptional regulator [Nocardia sp. CDC160]|uniref:MarR family winged helix-turn-helix transcriptional regulator n=1 Tax=Nocardia sp. CDC160 TaxID=3112166 RepID=UPI002DBE86CC|nr:MarR family transcriptional regulator [Nocardia sp. CDC160]MEC3919071.1 MarR family transcriptional regulator [Nocardia sp. CDC160]
MPSSTHDDPRATPAAAPGNRGDDDLADLFFRATKRLRRTQSARLAPLGLTPAQARALRIIGRADEHADAPLRMSVLAEHLGIVPRSATTVVDALVTAGLVAREPDPTNRRAMLVTPTDAGRHVLTQMSQARREAAQEMFAALTPAQRRTLRDALAALTAED